jgi:8-oxo-dGTP pyrophosphatase MutT (NUDIX family)
MGVSAPDVSVTLSLRRLGYRVAYRVLEAFWFITRPTKRGVKCVVTDRDRVLLVRHTYGRRWWDFPGGAIKRNELPLAAARREMGEELGLAGVDWALIGEFRGDLGAPGAPPTTPSSASGSSCTTRT